MNDDHTYKYNIVTWDLDSCLANTQHRKDYINPEDRENTDWVTYGNLADGDSPTGLAKVFRMYRHFGWLNFIITSRPNECREVTKRWLERHDLVPQQLMMRPVNSTEHPTAWKIGTIRDIQRAYSSPVLVHYDDWWSTNRAIEKQLGVSTVTVRVYDPSEVKLRF